MLCQSKVFEIPGIEPSEGGGIKSSPNYIAFFKQPQLTKEEWISHVDVNTNR